MQTTQPILWATFRTRKHQNIFENMPKTQRGPMPPPPLREVPFVEPVKQEFPSQAAKKVYWDLGQNEEEESPGRGKDASESASAASPPGSQPKVHEPHGSVSSAKVNPQGTEAAASSPSASSVRNQFGSRPLWASRSTPLHGASRFPPSSRSIPCFDGVLFCKRALTALAAPCPPFAAACPYTPSAFASASCRPRAPGVPPRPSSACRHRGRR